MNPNDLSVRLEGYLALRRALGFTMRAEAGLLRDFVRFVQARDLSGPITAPVAVDWACSASARCGAAGQAQRLRIVRVFLSHLRALIPETEIPGPELLGKVMRPKPYIYSPTEIEKLVQAALQLGPRGSLRPHTFATLIGLLASSGLRVGEAIRLTITDAQLNLDLPQLEVRETKFRKSRLVPLHASAAERLRQYTEQRRRLGYAGLCDAFFVSEQGGSLSYDAVRCTFITLARRIGIRTASGGRGPGVHALRHTFAIRRMLLWYQEGVDVRAWLPHLSVYLGHVRPETTYWYLTATPALLSAAAQCFESYAGQGGDL